MREAAFNSRGDGVIRINGTEVMRLAPGQGPPFNAIPFDIDVTAFGGQYVMVEFVCDGDIHGADFADWIAPKFVVSLPPPSVVSAAYDYSRSPNKIAFTFNEDIFTTMSAFSTLQIRNRANDAPVNVTGYSIDHNAYVLTLTFSGPIPDGNYRGTLNPDAVTNALGTPMTAAYLLDFFFMNGDANHDRTVDTVDFNILASNFGNTGKIFSEGNFNYDSVVDTIDFNILAARFATTLAPPQGPAASAQRSSPPSSGQSSISSADMFIATPQPSVLPGDELQQL